MNFTDLITKRYSVRKFSNELVDDDKLNLILKAGQIAPTAANFQPQRILIINKKEMLKKLKQCTPYIFEAPLALVVCYDNTVCWTRKYDGQQSGYVDSSIVTTHMMLQATDLGLGSLWIMSFNPETLIKLFKLPENIIPVAILAIGNPAADAKPDKFHTERLDIEKIAFHNEFKNK